MQRFIPICLIAFAPGIAAAESHSGAPDPVPADTKSQDETFLRSLDEIDVVATDGRKIGEIEEVLIDTQGAPASYVVEVGGFLGLGDHEVAVPIEAFSFANGAYVTKMTEEQLTNLPEWDD